MNLLTRLVALSGVMTLVGLRPAAADSLQLQSAAAGATSSWQGDGAVLGAGSVGYRVDDQLALQLLGQGGYAGLGHRVITAVGVGAQLRGRAGRSRPYVRGAFLRANEQAAERVVDDPLGALLGTSDGIAHRFGAMGAAGVELPIVRAHGLTFYLTAEVAIARFLDGGPPPDQIRPLVVPDSPSCPQGYASLALGLGLEIDLARLRNRP